MDLIDFSFNQTSWCHENPIIVPESSADSIYPGVLRDEVLEMLLPKHIGGSDEKHEINPSPGSLLALLDVSLHSMCFSSFNCTCQRTNLSLIVGPIPTL